MPKTTSKRTSKAPKVEEPEIEVEDLDDDVVIVDDEPEDPGSIEDSVEEADPEEAQEVITAKMLALELGTDPRTFRKFLRTIIVKDNQPGQGGRWEFDAETAAEYRAKWVEHQAGAKVRSEGSGKATGKKARREAKVAAAEELADVDLDLDAEFTDLLADDIEPTADELEDIEDVEDAEEDDDIEEI